MRYLYSAVTGFSYATPPTRNGVGKGQCIGRARIEALRGRTVRVFRRAPDPGHKGLEPNAWVLFCTFKPKQPYGPTAPQRRSLARASIVDGQQAISRARSALLRPAPAPALHIRQVRRQAIAQKLLNAAESTLFGAAELLAEPD